LAPEVDAGTNAMTDPAPKPIAPLADRIRDVADWFKTQPNNPETDRMQIRLRDIASEIEEKAAEIREANRHHVMESQLIEDWADSLAKKND
jgi:hypothetical protein